MTGRTWYWPLEWVATAPSGRAHTHGADAGQTGWRLHLVDFGPNPLPSDQRPALCGLRPGTGWAVDMFIYQECARCAARAIKLRVYKNSEYRIENTYRDAPVTTWETVYYGADTRPGNRFTGM